MCIDIKIIRSSGEPINERVRKTLVLQPGSHCHRLRRVDRVNRSQNVSCLNYHTVCRFLLFYWNLLRGRLIRKILVHDVKGFSSHRRRTLDALEGPKNDLVHPGVEGSALPGPFGHDILVDCKVHGVDGFFGLPGHEVEG